MDKMKKDYKSEEGSLTDSAPEPGGAVAPAAPAAPAPAPTGAPV